MRIKNLVEKAIHALKSIPRPVMYAVFIALVLHIGGLLWVLSHAGVGVFVSGDAVGYLELASNLKNGFGFSSLQGDVLAPEVFRTPGLPLLLVPFAGSALGLTIYLLLLTIISAMVLPILLWWIGTHTLGKTSGIVGAWFIALDPMFIFFSWFPITEIPFLIFALFSIVFLIQALRYTSYWWGLLAGLLAGLAVYIRPGNLLLFLLGFGIITFYFVIKRKKTAFVSTLIIAVLLASLAPWMVRTHNITGTYALSGAGWRNVYTDYLASIRAIENNTTFWDEKAKLKKDAIELLGFSDIYEVNNPANASVLREYALKEIINSPTTVLKLETLLMVSFFTNDGTYSLLTRLGFLPAYTGRLSPTYIILTEGFSGIPAIFSELKRQWFIPVLGRLYTGGVLLLAVFGFLQARRNKLSWLFFVIIMLSAVTSSVIGLGVEARLRMAIAPFLFLLAGKSFEWRKLKKPKTIEQ